MNEIYAVKRERQRRREREREAFFWHCLLHVCVYSHVQTVCFCVKMALESHLIFIIHKKFMYVIPQSSEIPWVVLMARTDRILQEAELLYSLP